MDNKVRIKEIEKEIDSLNIQMKSKKYDRYTNEEKKEYIQKQIVLFTELLIIDIWLYYGRCSKEIKDQGN